MSGNAPAFSYRLERVGALEFPVIRRGPDHGPCIIFAQPLFEEHNRSRRLFADLGRALAGQGFHSALPDLPGTGDHTDLRPFDLARARSALADFAAVQPSNCLVSLRGGALLLPPAGRRLALAPVWEGQRLLADLIRTHAVAVRESDGGSYGKADAEAAWTNGDSVHLAGYEITAATAEALSESFVGERPPAITMGRDSDVTGPPVWRQADPKTTGELAATLAGHIVKWLSA